MANVLHLATNLTLPLEFVTEKLAFLGRTGTGKTYAATKLAEEMLKAGAQIVVLDAVGVWYGLRIGFESNVYIFGGLHGDLPLESAGGALIADIIVDRGISAVLDVSQFEYDTDMHRFAKQFGDRFFFRKKAQKSAVHVFLEECQEFVPQNPQGGEQQVLHSWNRIWKLGRNFGIGGSLISQRPQEVNKKALNQTGAMFVFQQTGPQERKAIEGWISYAGLNVDIGQVLPTLRQGEPQVWSPSHDINKKVRIAKKESADISATPKVGEEAHPLRLLTPIDISQLREQMTAIIDRTKESDPEELKKQIRQLKRQLQENNAAEDGAWREKFFKVLDDLKIAEQDRQRVAEQVELIRRAVEQFRSRAIQWAQTLETVRAQVQTSVEQVAVEINKEPVDTREKSDIYRRAAHDPRPESQTGRSSSASHAILHGADRADLPTGEAKVLAAAIQHGSVTRSQLTVLTGYRRSSRDAFIQRLKAKDFIEVQGDEIRPTRAGKAALPSAEPLPSGLRLREFWLQRLPEGERRILKFLIDRFPNSVNRNEISDEVGYKRSSRDAFIQRLKSKNIVVCPGFSEVRASRLLFE